MAPRGCNTRCRTTVGPRAGQIDRPVVAPRGCSPMPLPSFQPTPLPTRPRPKPLPAPHCRCLRPSLLSFPRAPDPSHRPRPDAAAFGPAYAPSHAPPSQAFASDPMPLPSAQPTLLPMRRRRRKVLWTSKTLPGDHFSRYGHCLRPRCLLCSSSPTPHCLPGTSVPPLPGALFLVPYSTLPSRDASPPPRSPAPFPWCPLRHRGPAKIPWSPLRRRGPAQNVNDYRAEPSPD